MVIIKVFPYFCRLNSYRQTTNFNMNKCSVTLVFALIVATLTTWAQGPNNSGTYYQPANGKSGQALKTALYQVISSHKDIGYAGLWTAYKDTDKRPDGYLRDWYSNVTSYVIGGPAQGASYKAEGDSYNREHLVPQSWFDKKSPMRNDAHHVVPTDGYINNMRGDLPFGEVGTVSNHSANNYSKVGRCKISGYTGQCFEPNDEIKGDVARAYFYMVTCYENNISTWSGANCSYCFDGSKYPAFEDWFLKMLMRWSKQDPVNEVERDRNNAVYGLQKNRNPFIDYPGLEELIWGDRKTEAFDYTNGQGGETTTVKTPTFSLPSGTYREPISVAITSSTTGASIFFTVDGSTPSASSTRYTEPLTISETTTVKAIATKGDEKSAVATAVYTIDDQQPDPVAEGVYEKITTATNLESGKNYLIVYESDNVSGAAYYDCDNSRGNPGDVTISSGQIDMKASGNKATSLALSKNASGQWTLYDVTHGYYLALTSTSNTLNTVETVSDDALWIITFEGGNAKIENAAHKGRFLQYNNSANIFRCYNGSQKSVVLYKEKGEASGIRTTKVKGFQSKKAYDLQGRPIDSHRHQRGIVVKNGRKYISK
jgi:endonuclease I